MNDDLAQRFNAVFMELIEAARARHPELEAKGKWQTDQHLHQLPELAEFVDLLQAGTRHILDNYHLEYDELVITGCWANIGFPGSRHRQHAHPNNFLSGVYYVNAPPGGDTINFHDPRPQAGMITPPPTQPSPFTAHSLTLNVRTGTLFYFPAWLIHSVNPNTSDQERISVSFNIMFPDFVQAMSPPKWEGNLPVTRHMQGTDDAG